jgi:ubiquitin-conjugating enzyme E2 variant
MIYELKIICGDEYPDSPPKIKFITKINMTGVDQYTGWVDNSKFSVLKNWSKENTIQDALNAIRKEMESSAFKKLTQPSEGTNFS